MATILVDFAEKLSQSLNIEYKYDPQFVVCENDPGTNPTTDAALLALLEGSVRDLRVGYEVKPVVHSDMQRISLAGIAELMLQAYYAFKFYGINHPLLVCFMDVTTWHYFKVEINEHGGLSILWAHTIEVNLQDVNAWAKMDQHRSFLSHELAPASTPT